MDNTTKKGKMTTRDKVKHEKNRKKLIKDQRTK